MPYNFLSFITNPIFLIIISIVAFLFWLTMLINCVKKTFAKPKHKIAWILTIVLFQATGAFIYWLAVCRRA